VCRANGIFSPSLLRRDATWTASKRAAIAAEGYDPDDPAVIVALARLRKSSNVLSRRVTPESLRTFMSPVADSVSGCGE
jgi:hypothetical protein